MEEASYANDNYMTEAKTTEALREASPIEKLAMEMRSAIDEQQKAVEVLTRRLAPIIRPEPETGPSDSGAPHPVRSPFVDEWSGMIAGVHTSTRRIHELIQHLDL